MGFGRAVDRIRHLQRCMGDERLSANAKLFYAYIMAHPKKWTLSLIAEQTKLSMKAAAFAFRQLVKYEYLVRKDD